MKKQLNPTIKAHLVRGALYLLLLLAVCAIPFALAQRHATRVEAKQDAAAKELHNALPASGAIGASAAQAQLPNISQTGQLQLPKVSSGPGVPSFRIPPVPHLPQVVLYDQLNNPGTLSSSSQDFEAAFDAFASANARASYC